MFSSDSQCLKKRERRKLKNVKISIEKRKKNNVCILDTSRSQLAEKLNDARRTDTVVLKRIMRKRKKRSKSTEVLKTRVHRNR